METGERVLVHAPVECRQSTDKKVFVTRIRALGLTAYGNNWDESRTKLKQMFATWVGLHRKRGTLEKALNRTKVEWWYESAYDGAEPYDVVTAGGKIEATEPPNQPETTVTFTEAREMVAA
jgi:hypothetical protein